jgi:hypothetical protein
MSLSRLAFLIFLSAPLMACASTLTVSADRGFLEEEVARLPPVKPVPLRVTIKVEAPELAAGQKPGRTGDPSFNLEYPAREMLEQVTQAAVARWFRDGNQDYGPVHLEVRLHTLIWDEYTDVFMWRPVAQVEIELRAENDSRTFVQEIYSSGKQKGEWLRKLWGPITNEHPPQYTRLIYRAMLLALDKAMADLAQRKLAPAAPP